MDTFQLHVPIKERLLINGYIRDCHYNQNIPYSINMLCIDFYHSIHILYYLTHLSMDSSSKSCWELGDIKLFDLDTETSYKCHIYGLNRPSRIVNAAICVQKDMKVPLSIFKDTAHCNGEGKNDVIFKCGGSKDSFDLEGVNDCSAFVLSSKSPNESGIKVAFNWELPSYPEPLECHRIVYSEKYGLLSVGGYAIGRQRSFYQLNMDLNNEKNKDWKWNEMPSTTDKRAWTSLVLPEHDKLLAVGGWDVNVGPIGSVEIFDFEQNEWIKEKIKQMKHKRYRNGILYHEELKRIYVCGGEFAEHNAEWYDFEKNQWFDDLPHIGYKVDYYPTMWLQTRNVLFYACASADCLQWIDLRVNKRWNTVYGKGKNRRSISGTFGFTYDRARTAKLFV